MSDVISLIKGFLDDAGRLTAFPAKRKKKLYTLLYLAGKFAPDRRYSQKECNDLLNQWHTFQDPATLRRELYDNRFLDREKDCSAYWLEAALPTLEDIDAKCK